MENWDREENEQDFLTNHMPHFLSYFTIPTQSRTGTIPVPVLKILRYGTISIECHAVIFVNK
jgi:hypothetical protein